MGKKLHLCILGCGAIAKMHAKALHGQSQRVDLYFASRSITKAEEYCRKYGGQGVFGSYEEACRDPRIKAVLICTPHHFHFPEACFALSQNKHVIVEKPMATSIQDAKKMGRHLLVAENYRFLPSVRKVQSILDAGDLGTLKWIRINVMGRRTIKQDEWRAQEVSMGGGPFIDGGIHWVNVLLTYSGGNTVSVFAQKASRTTPNCPYEDTIAVLCKSKNDVIGTLTYSWGISGTSNLKLYSLHGSEGSLYVSNNGLLAFMRGKRRFFKLFPIADWRGFHAMWLDFITTIETGSPSLMTGLEGARDVAFVQKAYESAETGEAKLLPSLAELT